MIKNVRPIVGMTAEPEIAGNGWQHHWVLDHCVSPASGIEGEVEQAAASFIAKALVDLGGRQPITILDLGCGSGRLVRSFRALGLDAWGCDIQATWGANDSSAKHLRVIPLASSYRLPFQDASFDSVVSTSVLEHAQNKDEIFREIHRILIPGGQMLHMFPGKFFLPREPHIHVPLVNWFWPNVPRFWLTCWAVLGIRNEFQSAMGWREVADVNAEYVKRGLSYCNHRGLERSVKRIFGNCEFPNRYYVSHAPGKAAALCRMLPFKSFTAWAIGRFHTGLLYAEKV
jgi:SAM-dependent methyltransferase